MQLVRVGNRVLLISSSGQHSDTLAEFTDPSEILEIERLVREGNPSFMNRVRNGSIQLPSSQPTRRNPVFEA